MNTMVQSAIQTSNEMQRQLIARAGEDADFRAQLMADPKGTVKQEFGIDVPDYINIQVHESDWNVLHLGLPPGPEAEMELDEERLEAIAAGLSCCA
ncbi:NHLP leader peptide family RiPP precursor [Candidatus Palauibacter sp.]|uniref:NHLP leader peptide family RiPP precursor n=1 Tax=Candidatus Palauibacter sp. TaxID=3101350 RepID=UPI003B5223D6